MSEQLYKLFNPRGAYPLSALEGSKPSWHPAAQAPDPEAPTGEWYCQNPHCVVRQCRIDCKLYDEPLPPMFCPACQAPLKFHHWLADETLVPVEVQVPADGKREDQARRQ